MKCEEVRSEDLDCGKVGDEREKSTAAIRPIQEENVWTRMLFRVPNWR